ncbi:MAG: XdhC family protein [Acidobacteriota bacterium]
MSKDLELWQFVHKRLMRGEPVMLLAVAASSGSSPGREGYKMAVAADGELCGSIGGGVMEVKLVEQARAILSEPGELATGLQPAQLIEQEHRKNAENPSGMICSGRQTVIRRSLSADDAATVVAIIEAIEDKSRAYLRISENRFDLTSKSESDGSPIKFEKQGDAEFRYIESLGPKNVLFIVGGGHCALALSEIAAKLDFRVSIFDDRPELNTIGKNDFADEITIINGYETIGEHVAGGEGIYVVVMTLGYKFDEIVIRQLIGRKFKYFGVLGSRAKMKTLLTSLEKDGFPAETLAAIRTPIGLPINSHTPEEIAVSIAAEIIQVKNA